MAPAGALSLESQAALTALPPSPAPAQPPGGLVRQERGLALTAKNRVPWGTRLRVTDVMESMDPGDGDDVRVGRAQRTAGWNCSLRIGAIRNSLAISRALAVQ